MTEKNIVQTIHDTLWDEMKQDERVLVLGEDVGARGGVFRATAGFLDEFGERRVVDTPLAESGIVGSAIGMAMNGLLPVAEIQFPDFIHPAFDQLVSEAARIRYRSAGDWNCPLVVRAPWGGGVHGALYHSQSIEAFYGHVPGLKVVLPSTAYDTKGLLLSAIDDPDPVLFLEHKKTYRLIKGDVPDERYTVPIGKADVKREGEDLTAIAYGLMLHLCLEAARRLQDEEGFSVEVVDVRTIAPLDRETILDSVGNTLRERFDLRRQMNALTAQQRLSSMILTGLPFGLLAFLFVMDRSFVDPLFTQPIGQVLLVVAGVMVLIGWTIMSSMGRIEV